MERDRVERRVAPHNIDAEASVLGGVLLRNEALNQIDQLAAEDFYDPRHREVFGAMKVLEARSRPIDPVTLEDQLAQAGRLQAVGGLAASSPPAPGGPPAGKHTPHHPI